MELRHLDTLLAIDEEGSFTAAAESLSTVQSNVSEQVRQLEAELGASLLVRSRRGALPTECGDVVLDRARRIRREIEAMRVDLAAILGLEVGESSFGIVGTASRWVVPPVVAELRARAPGVRLRIQEAASERLVSEVADGDLAQAVVTEPVTHPRLRAEPLLEEALVAVIPIEADLHDGPAGARGAPRAGSGPAADREPAAPGGRGRSRATGVGGVGRGRGRGHPAHRGPRRRGSRRVDPPGDRTPARAARRAHGAHRRDATTSARPDPGPRRAALARRSCRSGERPRRRRGPVGTQWPDDGTPVASEREVTSRGDPHE